jgi:hypothetical protein
MEKQFVAGQKVKCIKARGSYNKLQEGNVYTVERIGEYGEVFLVEEKNPGTYSGWYGAKRFELVPEQVAPRFKAGDKARVTYEGYPGAWAKDKVVIVTGYWDSTYVIATDGDGGSGHITEDKLELVTEPEQEFIVTRVYPNGGYGVTHYFDTEQAARDYLQKAGNTDGGYKLSRLADSQLLKVQEETTVTRTVEAV